MKLLEYLGLGLFLLALIIFTAMLGMNSYELSSGTVSTTNQTHKGIILDVAQQKGVIGKSYPNNLAFIKDYKAVLKTVQESKRLVE